MVGIYSHPEHHPDAEHREETDLVDHSVFHSAGEHRDLRAGIHGNCGSAREAGMVGNPDARAAGEHRDFVPAGVFGLSPQDFRGYQGAFTPAMMGGRDSASRR